jgi:hypothetical protein
VAAGGGVRRRPEMETSLGVEIKTALGSGGAAPAVFGMRRRRPPRDLGGAGGVASVWIAVNLAFFFCFSMNRPSPSSCGLTMGLLGLSY